VFFAERGFTDCEALFQQIHGAMLTRG